MSAVEILAAAAQADSGEGEAVNVSEFSTLRLNWTAHADIGRSPQIDLAIDTAPTATGPWREISSLRLTAADWNVSPRVTLTGVDEFIRARWSGHARSATPRNDQTIALTLALAGDGKPDAE